MNTGIGNYSTPIARLLRTTCLGCHSNTGPQTIVYYMGNKVPIVYNQQKPGYETPGPNNALAGGNFYWTDPNSGADFADNHGHNLFSIDQTLTHGPGFYDGVDTSQGCGCHISLSVTSNYSQTSYHNDECQACHWYTFHHKAKGYAAQITVDSRNLYSTSKVDPTYRFLDSPPAMPSGYGDWTSRFVQGIEDPNFEQSPSAAAHNVYMANGASAGSGFVPSPSGWLNSVNHSLSSFCGGCHTIFHWYQKDSSNVWIRHPVDVLVGKLVDDGRENESFFYNGTTGVNTYDPKVPVAYDIANPYGDSVSSYSTIDDTHGKVTCVSCHRTHASPYPSMLRFNYNQIVAGNGTTAGGNGCFACHTEKALE